MRKVEKTVIRSACNYCGKIHGEVTPFDCQVKNIAAMALFKSLGPLECKLICEKTNYLNNVLDAMKGLIKTMKEAKRG